jgi:hypothetical protein
VKVASGAPEKEIDPAVTFVGFEGPELIDGALTPAGPAKAVPAATRLATVAATTKRPKRPVDLLLVLMPDPRAA